MKKLIFFLSAMILLAIFLSYGVFSAQATGKFNVGNSV